MIRFFKKYCMWTRAGRYDDIYHDTDSHNITIRYTIPPPVMCTAKMSGTMIRCLRHIAHFLSHA